jgi:PemK-like, MazF-like toxin of type II toxin-antitoxin system
VEGNDPNIDRVALTDQIRALDKRRFRRKFGHVSTRAMNSILIPKFKFYDSTNRQFLWNDVSGGCETNLCVRSGG